MKRRTEKKRSSRWKTKHRKEWRRYLGAHWRLSHEAWQLNHRREMALMLAGNSIYGKMARSSTYGKKEFATSYPLAFAAWRLGVIEDIKASGAKVVYEDTDSVITSAYQRQQSDHLEALMAPPVGLYGAIGVRVVYEANLTTKEVTRHYEVRSPFPSTTPKEDKP